MAELNIPTGIFPRLHIDFLKRASEDPLLSQVVDDAQPPSLIPATEDSEAEYKGREDTLRHENRVAAHAAKYWSNGPDTQPTHRKLE